MNSENEFIAVLPSNTPSTIKNSSSNYLTTFNDPIYLEGEWNVALMEVMFKSSIKTITNDSATIREVASVIPENINTPVELKMSSKLKYFEGVHDNLKLKHHSKKGKIIYANAYQYIKDDNNKMYYAEDYIGKSLFRFYHENGKMIIVNDTDYVLYITLSKNFLQSIGFQRLHGEHFLTPTEMSKIVLLPGQKMTGDGRVGTHVQDGITYIRSLPSENLHQHYSHVHVPTTYTLNFSNPTSEAALTASGAYSIHNTLYENDFKKKQWYFIALHDLKILVDSSDIYMVYENDKIVIYNNRKFPIKMRLPLAQAICLGFLPLSALKGKKETDFYDIGFIFPKQGLAATFNPLIYDNFGVKKVQWMEHDPNAKLDLNTRTVQSVIKCKFEDVVFNTDKIIQKLNPKEGWYADSESIVTTLNKEEDFKKYCEFAYDKNLNRFIIITKGALNTTKKQYYLELNHSLKELLGFKFSFIPLHDASYLADMQVDRSRGINTIFIYCDLLEEVRVGNSLVPLLRTVPFNNNTYGGIISITYDKPIYLPIRKNFIDKVKIELRDSIGELIPFDEGLTTVILHFKRL